MSCKLLGNTFDIHGGGADLQFPHHENEIAQSVGATGEGFAQYWMHNGFVRVETNGQSEKMSKSLNNFFTIRDILKVYDAEVVRFFILRAQYRSQLTYSEAHVQDAKAALGRLYTAVGDVQVAQSIDWTQEFEARFAEAMNDDMNTPIAVSVLFEMANEVNRTADQTLAARLKALAQVLGLLGRTAEAFQKAEVGDQAGALDEAEIQALIDARAQAKADRDFSKADAIRQQLLDMGVVLEDKRGGATEWRRA